MGTKESVPIQIADTLGNLTTLTGHDLRYDLFYYGDDGEEVEIFTNASCSNDDMIALPLIDTTTVDFAEGVYNVYLTFTNGSEEIRMGPFKILVDD